MILSIIIPAYNAVDYIEKCIRTAENQDIPKDEYEIIVVNDGSTDGLELLIHNLQLEYSNLILINQENQGVSAARNKGFANARGKYLLPIDSDDFIEPNSFKLIVEKLGLLNPDLLFLHYQKIDELGKVIWQSDFSEFEGKIDNTLNSFYKTKGENSVLSDPDRSWAIIYLNEKVKLLGEPYPLNVPYLEDSVFLAKYLSISETIAYHQPFFYYRTIRRGSAVNSNLFINEKAMNGFHLGLKHINNFIIKNQSLIKSSQKLNYLYQVEIKFATLGFSSAINAKNKIGWNSVKKMLVESGIKFKYAKARFPYNHLGFLLNNSINLLYCYLYLMPRIFFVWHKLNKKTLPVLEESN